MIDYRYAPAIALSIVTHMSVTASILLTGFVVTVYTALGGLKGVVWTDTLQFMMIFGGLLAIVIQV